MGKPAFFAPHEIPRSEIEKTLVFHAFLLSLLTVVTLPKLPWVLGPTIDFNPIFCECDHDSKSRILFKDRLGTDGAQHAHGIEPHAKAR